MITCPVCEHQQAAGSECEVCGRRLAEGRGTDAPVAPLEGLEQTSQADPFAAAAAGEPLAELELTHHEAAEEPLLSEVVEGLEQTGAEAVEVAVEPTPDVEHQQAGLPDDGLTLVLGPTCRYCRTEGQPGDLYCATCHRRLDPPAAEPARRAPAGPQLCSCGTPVTRARCPACGARNATP